MTDAAADGTRENGPETRNSREGRCAPPGRIGVVAKRDENQNVRTENYTISPQKSTRTPICTDRGVLHCVNTCPKAPELQFVFGLQ